MQLHFNKIHISEKIIVLNLLKEAAIQINNMNIDHWQYWKNPPPEKIKWIESGINNGEFYFVNNNNFGNVGMVRITYEDLLYWGKQTEKATYIHSLVVKNEYKGKGIGNNILALIGANAKNTGCIYLRLDADSKNPKLCKYYTDQGFKKVGEKILTLSTYNLYQKLL